MQELTFPFVRCALAMPIRSPEGYITPMVFEDQFPPPPVTDARLTFYDKEWNVVPHPTETTQYLPEYCYVQYEEEFPPPPPPGYQYVRSELEKDVLSSAYHYYHEIGTPRYGIDTPNHIGFSPYELTLQERSGMVSTLVELTEGYYSVDVQKLISNFIIEPLRLIKVIGVNGPITELLEYNIYAKRKCLGGFEQYPIEELDKFTDFLRSKFNGCDLNYHASKASSSIVFHLRSMFLDLPKAEKYCNSGWYKINGSWHYVQDSAKVTNPNIIFDTGYKIAVNKALPPREAMQSAMGVLNLCSDSTVIVPMVLFAHLGTMFTLFEDAGFPPRMLMFINGKTGSLKTAVSSVLFNLTGDIKRNIPATFRDTVASVEAKFPDYADKVLLLDDYAPAMTAKNKADMNKLLEDVIRYFGDGRGRGRSNVSVSKAVTTVPRGLCCITGEDSGGSQSSLLRCILIDVANGTFDGERLAPYQSEPTLWTTHFDHFTRYVAERFELLQAEIRKQFPLLRSKMRSTLTAGRVIDSAIYLHLTAQIVLEYGIDIGWISTAEAGTLLEAWTVAIINALKRSEDASKELDPVPFYITTLFEAVDSGTEIIAPDKETFLADPSVLGYDSNGDWHVWPDRLYALAVKRCQLHKKNFPLSQKKTHTALADAHVIRVSTDKRGDTTQINYLYRENFGERPRMLVINKDAAQRLLGE